MAQNQVFKRYLDAGIQFSQMTQQRAEALVRDLVRAGEVQAEQTQTLVNELVDRSRRNTERLVEQIRSEVRNQLEIAEMARKDVVARMQAQIDDLRRQGTGVQRAAAKKAPANKAAAKKPAATKATTNKATTNKATTNKATTNKATTNKAAAKRATASKAAAKTAGVKRTTAKRASAKKAASRTTGTDTSR